MGASRASAWGARTRSLALATRSRQHSPRRRETQPHHPGTQRRVRRNSRRTRHPCGCRSAGTRLSGCTSACARQAPHDLRRDLPRARNASRGSACDEGRYASRRSLHERFWLRERTGTRGVADRAATINRLRAHARARRASLLESPPAAAAYTASLDACRFRRNLRSR